MRNRSGADSASLATEASDSGQASSLWSVYRPLLNGWEGSVIVMAVASFLSGMAEALLLVLLANLALAVGGTSSGADLAASLGPLGSIDLTIRTSFIAALVLTVLRAGGQLLAASLSAKIAAGYVTEVRAGTLEDFAAASWAEQSRRDESEVQDLLQRHVLRSSAAIGIFAQGITTAFTLLALLLSAVAVDPIAAVLLVLSGGVLFLLIRPLSRAAKGFTNAQIQAGTKYARLSLEATSTSLEARTYGVGDQIGRQLRSAVEQEATPIRKALYLKQVVATTYQTATVALLLGGLLAAYTIIERPLASLGAIVIILVRSLNQAATLQSSYHTLAETAPFLERLDRERAVFRASAPPAGSCAIDKPGDLRCEHVDYSYDGTTVALSDVDFEIHKGEAVGIIGPSGSGKSTLIQILLRLRHPTRGRYLVGGTDASDVDDGSWFSQIAFVPQDSRVINDTVAANIAFHRIDVTREDVIAAAKRAHLHDEIEAMANGYDTVLGSRGGALSGGQRQRISIARALVRRPSILVLDEPTSALDMRSESLVHETFTELRGEVTIVVIAHRLSTLNSCDRILVMGDGKIQALGTRPELERVSGFYRDALAMSHIRIDG